MRYGWMVGLALAAPAGAQDVVLGDCRVEPSGTILSDYAICPVTNGADEAIASVRYGFKLVEPGRTVPWDEGGYGPSVLRVPIPGGIEPGETVEVVFYVDKIEGRADPARVHYVLEILEAYNVDDEPIVSE
jgi:hypothetical protein